MVERFTAAPVAYQPSPLPLAPLDEGQPSILPDIPVPSLPSASERARANVTQAAERTRESLTGRPSAQALLDAAVARRTGNGVATATGVERDLATLSYDQIRERYGRDQGNALIRDLLRAEDGYTNLVTGQRSGGEAVRDSLTGAAIGLSGSLAGIGALGVGLASPQAGAWASQRIGEAVEAAQGTQSQDLQNRRAAAALRNRLSARDNAATREREDDELGSFAAAGAQILRDARDVGADIISDPALLGDTVAQGVGSLFAGGPVARLLGAAGGAASAGIRAGAGVVAGEAGAQAASRALAAAASRAPSPMAGAIGLMEGGSAYQQTTADIIRMGHEELRDRSPRYRELLESGMSPDQARTTLASEAGQTAAAIAGPVGVATGRLVQGFEGAPLRVGSIPGAIRNMGLETVEEGAQSVSGQMSQNYASRDADPNRSLAEGVGEQLATGAIGGLGTAGAVQAPGVSGRAAAALARASGQAVLSGLDAVAGVAENQTEALRARNEAASPASEARVAEAAAQATAQAPQAEATLREAVQAGATSPEQRAQSEQAISQLMEMHRFREEELQDEGVTPDLRQLLTGSSSRVEAVQRLARVVETATVSSPENQNAAFMLYALMQDSGDTTRKLTQKIQQSLPEGHAAHGVLRQYAELNANLEASPKVQQIFKKIEAYIESQQAAQAIKPVVEAEISTLEGQQQIANAMKLAEVAPDKANLEANQQILAHHEGGRLQLTPEQKAALWVSTSMLTAARDASETQKKLGHVSKLQAVSDAIQVDTESKQQGYDSARQWATRVMQAVRSNDNAVAAEHMLSLKNLVQTLNNKVGAYNTHFEKGGARDFRVPYQAVSSEDHRTWGVWKSQKGGVYIQPKRARSIELAQTAQIEATRLATIYNGLSQAFPELQAGFMQGAKLDQALLGKPADVALAFQEGRRVRPGSRPKAESSARQEVETKAMPPSARRVEEQKPNVETKEVPKAQPEVATKAEAKPQPTQTEPKQEPKAAAVTETDPAPQAAEPATRAAAEPEAEPAEAPKAAKTQPKTMKEAFPTLFGDGQGEARNWFRRAFKLPKTMTSRLFGLGKPAETLAQALRKDETIAAFIGKSFTKTLDAETRATYQELVSSDLSELLESLEKRLNGKPATPNKTGKNAGESMLTMLTKGIESNRFKEGKALNLVERRADGGFRYNQPLMEQALLAAFQWAITADDYRSQADQDYVASLTGIPAELIGDADVDSVNFGLSPVEAVSSLTDKIVEYWGVQPDGKAPIGMTRGIPQAVALEIMEVLQATGLLQETVVEVRGVKVPRLTVFGRIRTSVKANAKLAEADRLAPSETLVTLQQQPRLLDELVLQDPPERNYYGSDRPAVAETQLRNPAVPNTDQQKDVLKAVQNIPHYLNTTMLSFYEQLTLNGMLDLFGAGSGDLDSQPLNAAHRLSLKGVNQMVSSAFQALQSRKAEMQSLENGKADITTTPIHFRFNFSSIGRLQMLGANTPQGNKLVREVILPTWSTLDLRQKEGSAEHRRLFDLAVAQALGVKIHAISSEAIQEKLVDALAKLERSIELLEEFQGTSELPGSTTQALKANFAAAGVELTPVAIHALMEQARLRVADEDARKEFRTALYVEADGATNGMFNAMSLMTAGEFTPDWVNNVARGGMSFSSVAQSLNQLRALDSKDLYEVGADATRAIKDAAFARWGQYAKPGQLTSFQEQSIYVDRLFDLLLPGAELKEDTDGNWALSVKRGVTKNPMTITIYGSGQMGIAGNLTQTILGELAERMSQAAEMAEQGLPIEETLFLDETTTDPAHAREKFDRFLGALNGLTGRMPEYVTLPSGEKKLRLVPQSNAPRRRFNPETFQLNPSETKAVQTNILQFFVRPMNQAIKQTMGDGLTNTTTLVREATQMQSIVMQEMFDAKLRALIAEKKAADPDYRKEDFVSKAELDTILAELLKTFPLVQTGTQNFFIAGNQSTPVDGITIARSFTGGYDVAPVIYQPKDAGVKGIPVMVVGPGDGQMTQNMIVAGAKGLPVFDGFNFALTDVMDGSRIANKAVWDSLQQNPVSKVQEAFATFARNLTPKMLESVPGLVDMLANKLKTAPNGEAIMGVLNGLSSKLGDAALQIEARHQAVAEVAHSVDQMASAEAPYIHEGRELDGGAKDVAYALETRRLEILKDLRSTAKEAAAAPNDFAQKVVTYGREVGKSGVRQLTMTSIAKFGQALELSETQRGLFQEIVRAKSLKGYTMLVGTVEQLRAYQKGTGRQVQSFGTDEAGKLHGLIVPGEKTIYLVQDGNLGAETFVHELVHASTFETLRAYYAGENLGENAEVITRSIKALEQLKEQFMAINVEEATQDVDAWVAFDNAYMNMLNHDQAGNQAAALNEFMAWTLANQDLAQLAGQTQSSLGQVVAKALAWIKKLFWKRSPMPAQGTTLLADIRFNTSVLVHAQPTIAQRARQAASLEHRSFGTKGSSDRLVTLESAFLDQIARYLPTRPGITEAAIRADNENRLRLLGRQAEKVARMAIHSGFSMTARETNVFKSMVIALATEAELDATSLAQMDKLYRQVIGKLDYTMLEDPRIADAQARKSMAEDQLNFLQGNLGTYKDARGRSTLLPVFMGLAAVHEGLRKALRDIPVPKAERAAGRTMDAALENGANRLMERLAQNLSGQGKAANVQQAVDALSAYMARSVEDRETLIETLATPVYEGVTSLNDRVVQMIEAGTDKAIAAAKQVEATSKSKLARTAANVVRTASMLATEKNSQLVAESVMQGFNRMEGGRFMREIATEVVGRTLSNAGVYDMVKRVRSMVQQVRQQFREQLPKTIEGQFSRKLSDAEWSLLHLVMGKTDLAALAGPYTNQEVLQLLASSTRRQAEIRRLETALQAADGTYWTMVQGKAQQLANFMTTGEAGQKLLRNAVAVARLPGMNTARSRPAPDQRYIEQVDQLVTLYALEGIEQRDAEGMVSVQALVQQENQGMDFVLSYLTGQRADELQRFYSGRAELNHFKGHLPALQQQGVSLIVAPDAQAAQLAELSYVRVGDYAGSEAEVYTAKRGYYFAPVTGKAAFNQGIMQTVRMTAFGVDAATGFSEGRMTAGAITDPDTVKELVRNLRHERTQTEGLMPVFDSLGEIVAFERAVDPRQLDRLNANTHLAKMIGVWRGRQAEERQAHAVNRELVNRLHGMYREDIGEDPMRKAGYVDLFDDASFKGDPVIRDALALMPRDMRAYVDQVFKKEGGFWVRRDMLNDVLGYREASIGDFWTGNSRFSPKTQKAVQDLVLGLAGNKAYQVLINGEQFIQGVVKEAKSLIVVKSVIVPLANMLSNAHHMLMRGVPLTSLVRDMPRKAVEVRAYVESQRRKIEAEAQLRAAQGGRKFEQQAQLEAEIKAIEDSHKRLSIWPLIKAGEFSAISDASITQEELLLTDGKLFEFMEQKVNQLPQGVRDFGRYAFITKDTALFQGLQTAVQYGDFLAKAVLYDHLTKRRGKTREEALGRITEEFVNYDRQAGRIRSYGEKMGLFWFWNYKLRAVKVAAATLRENPVQAFLSMLVPQPGILDQGTPLEDNIISKAWQGTLDNSVGPGMGFRSWQLNPWVNLVN